MIVFLFIAFRVTLSHYVSVILRVLLLIFIHLLLVLLMVWHKGFRIDTHTRRCNYVWFIFHFLNLKRTKNNCEMEKSINQLILI